MRNAKGENHHQMRIAVAAVVLQGGAAGAWGMTAPLGSAVVSQGLVVTEGNLRKVQRQTGGIVGALFVSEGQHVDQNELLVRLDDTDTRANLNVILNDLTAARARQARLLAEREGAVTFNFPPDLERKALADARIRSVLQSESQVFDSRRTTNEGLRQQPAVRIGQLSEEINGAQETLTAVRKSPDVATDERHNLEALAEMHLVARPRMTKLEREVVQSDGQTGNTAAKIAELKGKIIETQLQVSQVDKDRETEVAKDLRDTETKIGELQQRATSAREQMRRVEIRAPISGKVHQLSVYTVGGLVTPAESLMFIVTDTDRLIIEAKIAPHDIDQVSIGEDVRIRFTAFNKRTTPELKGRVIRLAGDLSHEQQSGAAYYLAGIAINDAESDKLSALKLVPGMPAETFIVTGERTFASYLMKPLADQMQRAAREK